MPKQQTIEEAVKLFEKEQMLTDLMEKELYKQKCSYKKASKRRTKHDH